MASGLYEMLDTLNEDRIQCAKTAKAFGLGNNENMKFSDIPNYLLIFQQIWDIGIEIMSMLKCSMVKRNG